MKLEINVFLSLDDYLILTVDNQEELLFESCQVNFDLEPGVYEISLCQRKEEKMPKYMCLLYLLFLPIQGIGNVIFFDLEEWKKSKKWIDKINPYYLCAQLKLELCEDQSITISNTKSRYENNEWKKGDLKIEPAYDAQIQYLPNPYDINDKFWQYIRKSVSISSLAITIFLLMLILSIMSFNIPMIVMCLSVLSLVSFLIYIQIQKEYKVMKKLIKSFKENGYDY